MPSSTSKNALLPLLVFSQFAGTSLWFVGNAVLDSLPSVQDGGFASLTSAVQLGFIAGTLVFSLFAVADRFSAPKLFFFSSLMAAAANLCLLWMSTRFPALLALRFVTGFFLAGIYPVGMKMAADFFPEKLGKALGFLVGALVLGTAFPHLVRSFGGVLGWRSVIIAASALAALGGLLILLFFPKQKRAVTQRSVRLAYAFSSFRNVSFRSAALGYFGHMWELYALWAVLPTLFAAYNRSQTASLPGYFWSFAIIATGGVGCAVGGVVSQKWGSKKVAFRSLLLSGLCCLLAPFFFRLHQVFFLPLLLVWGFAVTADSPQFSALVARFAEAENKGTALSIVTCIGFSITIVSIYLLKALLAQWGAPALWVLAAGPLFGLLSLNRLSLS